MTLTRSIASPRHRHTLAAPIAVVFFLVNCVTASVFWTREGADGHIFTAGDVPASPIALVLGTRVEPDHTPSLFLAARLEIAYRLFTAGKVRTILVSGDHASPTYNEPGAMQRWLLDRRVPAKRILLDHAGLDTYDSCARAKRLFGVDEAIVVTQSFHLPRAVTLCRSLGIKANGVGDETARKYGDTWWWSSVREYGACVKAALDVLAARDPADLSRRTTGQATGA
ncbi:SanA/YdcF family protein [Micromonospora sp. RP3T]|uniref:SanA/YdcF family protein n=1 Tax=Micromonospora sp. RP3T TaxID=2135446 RepID=UPI003D71D44D